MPRAVVFDFDGTLVDTMRGFTEIASRIMHEHHGMPLAEAREKYLLTSGLPFFQQLELIFPGDPRNRAAVAQFEIEKEGIMFAEPLPAESREVVRRVSEDGWLTAVSSGSRQELLDRYCEREGIRFDAVLGARDGFYKGRDHFGWLRDHLGVGFDSMVFVGDSLMDAERARSCGVRFVARLGTFGPADFQRRYPGVPMIERLADLLLVLPAVGGQRTGGVHGCDSGD